MPKILVVLASLAIFPAQTWAVMPVIDNARVAVRSVTLVPGRPGIVMRHDTDFAILFLEGGMIRTTGINGKIKTALRRPGDAVFGTKGTQEENDVLSGKPARLVVVELKGGRAPSMVNKTGYPAAFPRPGSRKVLENSRVIVWNYDWVPGKPTPMHYHDKDVVVVYRGNGTLNSVSPDGKVMTTAHRIGEIRFNKGDRSHYELLTSGRQGAIMMELK